MTPYFDLIAKYKALLPDAEMWIIHRCCIEELDGVCVHPFDSQVLDLPSGRQFVKDLMDRCVLPEDHKAEAARIYPAVTCLVCGGYVVDGPVNVLERKKQLLAAVLLASFPDDDEEDS